MDEWRVTFTRVEQSAGEELQEKRRTKAKAKGTVSFYESGLFETVQADDLTVVGGALVFWRQGDVHIVFGPSSFEKCERVN